MERKTHFGPLLILLALFGLAVAELWPPSRAQSQLEFCDVVSGVVCVDSSTIDLDDPNDEIPPAGGQFNVLTSVAPNVRVNRGNDSGRPQNEPYIAVNPANPNYLVAGANDFYYGWPQSRCGFYRSTDGGGSWPDRGSLPLPQGLNWAGDPGLAFSPDGSRIFYSCLMWFHDDQTGERRNGSIYVVYSTDGGQTFPAANRKLVASGGGSVLNDKPFIAVDHSGSAHRGNVYVTWTAAEDTDADTRFDTYHINVARSTDNGVSFVDHAALSGSEPHEIFHGALPFVGPDGTAYVVYVSWGSVGQLLMTSSTTGGASWSDPRVVADYVSLPLPPGALPGTKFRVNSFPTAAVDSLTGQIYLAWADYRRGNADIFLTTSLNRGLTWNLPQNLTAGLADGGFDQFFPWLSVDPSGNVDLVYYSRFNTTKPHFNLFHQRSGPGGGSFGSPVQVNDVGPIRGGTQFNGERIGDYIGVVSGPVKTHAVWMDTRRTQPNSNRRQQDIFSAAVTVTP